MIRKMKRLSLSRVMCSRAVIRPASIVTLLAILSGCALPASAPTKAELTASNPDSDFYYAQVNVNSRIVSVLNHHKTTFGPMFQGPAYVPRNTLRPGDAVAITIYETGGSSLFPPPSNLSSAMGPSLASATVPGAPIPGIGGVSSANTIPPQVVEADGTIRVPFVGRIKAAGLTPSQIGAMLERDLRQKAVAPQVIVTLANNTTNTATISGEVNTPRVVPLSLRGERLLDVIAAGGGSKFPAYESYVDVVREGQVGKMLLQTVVSNPKENIVVRPNDQIYLTRNPRTFVVMGATQRPAVFPFDRESITLAEALAQAGGPVDTVGDPSGVYLFRIEPWQIAKNVLDASHTNSIGSVPPNFVPVLYRVGLRDAEGYFAAQSIKMRDKDIVLVTNAEATQLQKTLTLVRGFTGIAYDLKRGVTLN